MDRTLEDWWDLVVEMEAEKAFKKGNEERQENRTYCVYTLASVKGG